MDKEQEKKFNALREMFNSEGWKYFQEEVEESLKTSVETAPDSCGTEAEWQFRRGEIFKLRQIKGYQTYIEVSEQYMEEEDASV